MIAIALFLHVAALEGLHDIVVPPPVSMTPGTIGWLVLAALVLGISIWLIVRGVAGHRANRYRRLALRELDDLEKALNREGSPAGAWTRLPALVKRTMLAVRPRSEVAALTGEAWLQYLDRTHDGSSFTRGPGRILPVLADASEPTLRALAPDELGATLGLVRDWIRRHRVRV